MNIEQLVISARVDVNRCALELDQQAQRGVCNIPGRKDSDDYVLTRIKSAIQSLTMARTLCEEKIKDAHFKEKQGDMFTLPPLLMNPSEKIADGIKIETDDAKKILAAASVSVTIDFDPLYEQAVGLVRSSKSASPADLQRKFFISFNHAVRLLDAMESQGIISPVNSSGHRSFIE